MDEGSVFPMDFLPIGYNISIIFPVCATTITQNTMWKIIFYCFSLGSVRQVVHCFLFVIFVDKEDHFDVNYNTHTIMNEFWLT